MNKTCLANGCKMVVKYYSLECIAVGCPMVLLDLQLLRRLIKVRPVCFYLGSYISKLHH